MKEKKDLTPEQRQRLHQGCFYELMKIFATLLLVGIFLYALPMLGSIGTVVTFLFTIYGMAIIARWITDMIYPHDPLEELRDELKENEE